MATNGTNGSSSGLKTSNLSTRTANAFHPSVKALPSHFSALSQSTKAIHADDPLATTSDVAPPLHVSTTFRYTSDPSQLRPFRASDRPDTPNFPFQETAEHCYSRLTTHNTSRLEAILEQVLNAPTLTYTSGLSAIHAFLVHLCPRRVAIGDGYHGSHGVLNLHKRLSGLEQLALDCPASELHAGDVIMLETPINPHGTAFSIQHYADKAHSRGAYLFVDSTFGPPPLQDPFRWGADVVMHSGTKYIGGHSDMLCGTLSIRPGLAAEWVPKMLEDREFLGSVLGSMEGWLGVRSARTLELRVLRQSESADRIVAALQDALDTGREIVGVLDAKDVAVVRKVLRQVHHASLQARQDNPWLVEQMPRGFGPVFSISLVSEMAARCLPSKLHLFHHATSLGGVESLIEWRTMSDATVGRDLLRVSIGIEAWEDLLGDIVQGFRQLIDEFKL